MVVTLHTRMVHHPLTKVFNEISWVRSVETERGNLIIESQNSRGAEKRQGSGSRGGKQGGSRIEQYSRCVADRIVSKFTGCLQFGSR